MIQEHDAIYCKSNYGPSFGGGHDVHISNNANDNQQSYSYFNSYQPPTGTADANSLLAGSNKFTPTEIEVFIWTAVIVLLSTMYEKYEIRKCLCYIL